jgi:DNA-binding transcriptional LysR family regulator
METIISLVAAGLGVAVVPELFRSSPRDGVVFRNVEGAGTPIPYRIGLVWQKRRTNAILDSLLSSIEAIEHSMGGRADE